MSKPNVKHLTSCSRLSVQTLSPTRLQITDGITILDLDDTEAEKLCYYLIDFIRWTEERAQS